MHLSEEAAFWFLELGIALCFYQNGILETYREEVRPEILQRPSVTWILKAFSQFYLPYCGSQIEQRAAGLGHNTHSRARHPSHHTLRLRLVSAPSSRCCILGFHKQLFLVCAGVFKLLEDPVLLVEPTFPFQLYKEA